MSNIGKLNKIENDGQNKFKGFIRTMNHNFDFILIDNLMKLSENAPDFKIVTHTRDGEEIEIGAAWLKTSRKNGTEYISLSFDDPSFENPLYGYAFHKGEHEWDIAWSRPKKQEQQNAA